MIVLVRMIENYEREWSSNSDVHLVCDIIRSQDVPIGIRQTLTPVLPTNEQEQQQQQHCFQHSRGRSGDHYMLMDEDGKSSIDHAINSLEKSLVL